MDLEGNDGSEREELMHPSIRTAPKLLLSKSLGNFTIDLDQSLIAGREFAPAVRYCAQYSLLQLDQVFSGVLSIYLHEILKLDCFIPAHYIVGLKDKHADWDASRNREKLELSIEAHATSICSIKLSELIAYYKRQLTEELVQTIEPFFDDAEQISWESIRNVYNRAIEKTLSELINTLSGFELDPSDSDNLKMDLKRHAMDIVENKFKEDAKKIFIRLKDRFLDVFKHHNDSSPRIWTWSEDIKRIMKDSCYAALKVLYIFVVIRLDEKVDKIESILNSALFDIPIAKEDITSTFTEAFISNSWEEISPKDTPISPALCKSLWKEFIKETNFFVGKKMLTVKSGWEQKLTQRLPTQQMPSHHGSPVQMTPSILLFGKLFNRTFIAMEANMVQPSLPTCALTKTRASSAHESPPLIAVMSDFNPAKMKCNGRNKRLASSFIVLTLRTLANESSLGMTMPTNKAPIIASMPRAFEMKLHVSRKVQITLIGRIFSRLKDRFLDVFNHHNDSLPRIWTGSEDIKRITKDSCYTALKVLYIFVVIRLDEKVDKIKSIVNSALFDTPIGKEDQTSTFTEAFISNLWKEISPKDTPISPTQRKSLWKEFLKETNFIVGQKILTLLMHPSFRTALKLLLSKSLENFTIDFDQSLIAGREFATAVRDCAQYSLLQLDQVFSGLKVKHADWDASRSREKLQPSIEAHATSIRSIKLSELVSYYKALKVLYIFVVIRLDETVDKIESILNSALFDTPIAKEDQTSTFTEAFISNSWEEKLRRFHQLSANLCGCF